MPAPDLSPNSSTPNSPAERFNPTNLDCSVIAIPLQAEIDKEKALIQQVRQKYQKEAAEFNSVIFLPENNRVTSASTRSAVQKILDEALAAGGSPLEAVRPRHRIGRRVPGVNGFFAWLDARTIRRILSGQEGRRLHGENLTLEILQILPTRFQVIIDLNLEFIGGRDEARRWVEAAIPAAMQSQNVDDPGQGIQIEKSRDTNQYVFATIEADVIATLVEMDAVPVTEADAASAETEHPGPTTVKIEVLRRWLQHDVPAGQPRADATAFKPSKLRAIYRIWPDFEVKTRITRSISTVKANAAINSFVARGTDITWAVVDTGIQGDHPHFGLHKNIDPTSPLHRTFTGEEGGALIDANGHGTHVAGIIAGEWIAPKTKEGEAPVRRIAVSRFQDEHGDSQQEIRPIEMISGMAPECRLVSLKVLDENGIGNASNLIAAIAHVQEINGYGRRLLIHGVNISIGYDFDPKWFACGQSPLCVEVDRLVKSGVVVVVAAGNTGYGLINNGSSSAGLTTTINDPGNAELAITVGATHRDMPHVYGVSYFSSKGPTGDGRLKPDLVAPGERIISCASSLPAAEGGLSIPSELKREVARDVPCDYIETSGTSMAAPHVSGVVAAFLSVRREYIGRAEQVKEIFIRTSTDLRRDRYFQGAGLIDLMRAIQSV